MKLNTNTYSCDFCKNEIFPNYEPIGSRRGARVAICTVCGLLQTKLLADKYISQPPGSMSCDADRSSFRYTKTLVAKKYSKYLKISNLHKAKEILDIGSNRGAFINFLIENFDTKFKVTAIEPHEESSRSYANLDFINLKVKRIENTELENNKFDFVYCVHTLEHVTSVKATLKKIYNCMKPKANFFLTVPKYELYNDVVEELFIDPHTFHFTEKTLKNYINLLGFRVLDTGEANDDEIIFLLQKPKSRDRNFIFSENKINSIYQNELKNYSNLLKRNRKKIELIAKKISSIAKDKKVIIWGAGRIFDAIITIGMLKPNKNILVIDKYLSLYMDKISGFNISGPNKIKCKENSAEIFILSRAFAREIKEEAQILGFSKFHLFSDYFN